MDLHDVPKRRNIVRGLTLTEMLAALVMPVIFAAIFHPVFQPTRSAPNGAVRNSSGKPIPGAILRFRDPLGRVVATITADRNGEFQRNSLDDLSRNTVDGFTQSYSTHRSGGSDLYVFTPLETRTATFCDGLGKPVPSLAVSFGPDHSNWQHHEREPFEQVSDSKGTIQMSQNLVGTRFEFQSRDPSYIVERFQQTDDGKTIHYAVTVTAPGTITGCLRGEDGLPLPGYKAFATISPDLDRFDRWYAEYLGTGPTGRFCITGLRPRVYYVSVAPARGSHAVAPAQRITLASGQTAEVSLRMNTTGQTPNAH